MDIYRTFHPKTADYTFFSSAHGTFSRIDHILGHKSSLSKFKKIEIISSIFSDHNSMRLEMNYREKTVKNTNTWRLNNTLLNKHGTDCQCLKEPRDWTLHVVSAVGCSSYSWGLFGWFSHSSFPGNSTPFPSGNVPPTPGDSSGFDKPLCLILSTGVGYDPARPVLDLPTFGHYWASWKAVCHPWYQLPPYLPHPSCQGLPISPPTFLCCPSLLSP